MSTAWYRSNVVPKLIHSWKNIIIDYHTKQRLSVELWETTCIVTNFKDADCTVLINPANPSLSGVSRFPYFPKGGPEPKLPPNKDAHPIMGYVRIEFFFSNKILWFRLCHLSHTHQLLIACRTTTPLQSTQHTGHFVGRNGCWKRNDVCFERGRWIGASIGRENLSPSLAGSKLSRGTCRCYYFRERFRIATILSLHCSYRSTLLQQQQGRW